MKSIFFTLLFICSGIVAFAQTGQSPKIQDPFKSDQLIPSVRTNTGVKTTIPNAALTDRSAISVISIIPTLKLWLLPASFPNPFTKSED